MWCGRVLCSARTSPRWQVRSTQAFSAMYRRQQQQQQRQHCPRGIRAKAARPDDSFSADRIQFGTSGSSGGSGGGGVAPAAADACPVSFALEFAPGVVRVPVVQLVFVAEGDASSVPAAVSRLRVTAQRGPYGQMHRARVVAVAGCRVTVRVDLAKRSIGRDKELFPLTVTLHTGSCAQGDGAPVTAAAVFTRNVRWGPRASKPRTYSCKECARIGNDDGSDGSDAEAEAESCPACGVRRKVATRGGSWLAAAYAARRWSKPQSAAREVREQIRDRDDA